MSKDLNAVILNKCATQCIMSININHHTLETFRGDLLLEHKLCLYFIEKRHYKISFFEIINYYEIISNCIPGNWWYWCWKPSLRCFLQYICSSNFHKMIFLIRHNSRKSLLPCRILCFSKVNFSKYYQMWYTDKLWQKHLTGTKTAIQIQISKSFLLT